MKLALAILAVLLIAASLYADWTNGVSGSPPVTMALKEPSDRHASLLRLASRSFPSHHHVPASSGHRRRPRF
jgi:hypothetical protein